MHTTLLLDVALSHNDIAAVSCRALLSNSYTATLLWSGCQETGLG